MTFTAVVPAGGRLPPQDARSCGESVKALLPIGGESLLARLLRVLGAVELSSALWSSARMKPRLIAECLERFGLWRPIRCSGTSKPACAPRAYPEKTGSFSSAPIWPLPTPISLPTFSTACRATPKCRATGHRERVRSSAYPGSPSTFLHSPTASTRSARSSPLPPDCCSRPLPLSPRCSATGNRSSPWRSPSACRSLSAS